MTRRGRNRARSRDKQWVAGTPEPHEEEQTAIVVVVGDAPLSFLADETPIGFELAQLHDRRSDE